MVAPRRVLVLLGLAAGSLLAAAPPASAWPWLASFHTPDRMIQCQASMGAHGPGVGCQRRTDGRGLTVQWSGVLRWPPPGHPPPVRGPSLAYGKTRVFAYPREHLRVQGLPRGDGLLGRAHPPRLPARPAHRARLLAALEGGSARLGGESAGQQGG